MGGTDLNLKKSWHPKILANQRRVHDAEVSALEERKKTEARLQEIKAERAQEEIQRQLEAAGGKKRIDRVDWMYQGPTDGQVGDAYGNEAYLLGKRRIDNIIRGDETKNLQKQPGPDGLAPVQNVLSTRDTATKIREDPLLAIKKQEQSAYEALLNDPIKRRQLLANGSRNGSDSKNDEEERARKLAAMQDAASNLDEARESRLAALAAKERAERDADDRAREKASKYGDDRAFAKNLHRSVGEKSLADRVGRGRQNLQRDDD
ncbi:putative pre-mrna-splicing factor cwc25 protein [Phaeoacremonium minimum UCRPA7]|uniref:Putative pre-mrna-splicing factor cwc25 protein n=1 Tax=Phaeoacremonium minimum (strain UCR-PA7) TaxID=1286976 RepID=R8BQV8_PHAM7|nr:putative pre-mrna-splicing factor cwc25 protein [Phaeoacremonium minimum UCRPA7]EOO01675.1 putative pre-mrna-splicing factor cwc25 protein [Phaeoacremonium minimum UCRPA7]